MHTFLEFMTPPSRIATAESAPIPPAIRTWATQCMRTLTDDERGLLESYSREGNFTINAFLRGNPQWSVAYNDYMTHARTPQSHMRMMRGATTVIDRIFTKCHAPQPLVVYRGMALRDLPETRRSAAELAKLVGRKMTFAGYLSTSLKLSTAELFTSAVGPLVLQLFVPRGYPVIPILGMRGHRHEFEMLLPHATRGKVLRVDRPSTYITEISLQVQP